MHLRAPPVPNQVARWEFETVTSLGYLCQQTEKPRDQEKCTLYLLSTHAPPQPGKQTKSLTTNLFWTDHPDASSTYSSRKVTPPLKVVLFSLAAAEGIQLPQSSASRPLFERKLALTQHARLFCHHTSLAILHLPDSAHHRQPHFLHLPNLAPVASIQHSTSTTMERVFPFLTDTNGPYKQLLAAEQTAQTVQALIQEKKDAIRTIKQQAVDQYLPYDATYGQIKLLEDDIGAFKLLLESNEASRSQWREVHMAAWRATVRPLKVVDMPNEILTKIFANFEDVPAPQIQVDSSPFDDPLPSPDLASIKNIRLTCRIFCGVGSKFLLPVVDISFTHSSLQRLRDISNHSMISKSVHTLRIHANPYNPLYGNDQPEFLGFDAETYLELRKLHTAFLSDMVRAEVEISKSARLEGIVLQPHPFRTRELLRGAAFEESRRVLRALEKVRQDTRSGSSLSPYEQKISAAIDEVREEYRRRCLEQQGLIEDSHVLANIVTAVRQMPHVQRLCIPDLGTRHWDNIFRSGWGKRYDAQKYGLGMTAANPFWDLMVHGGYRDYDRHGDEAPQPPDEDPLLPLLHKMPFMLQAANRNLTHLDINLPPLAIHQMENLAEHLMSLRHSFQSLKFVQVRILETRIALESRADLAMTYSLLETMLISPRLEVLKLDYRHRGERSNISPPDESIGSVLANLPRNNLRSLWLHNFSFKVEELRQILQNVPGKIHFELNGIYLIEGTWAEALDVLRGRADSSSRVLMPYGGETKDMSKSEIRHFRREFNSEGLDGWHSKLRCPGPVCTYIRGGNIPHPLIWGDD